MKLSIIFWFLCSYLPLSLYGIESFEPIDCDKYYNLVYESLQRELPEDFFIINITTRISVNTNAPAVIGDYKAIRKKYGNEMLIILVVKDEMGYGTDKLKGYFEESFLFDFSKDTKIKIAHRDDLFDQLTYAKSLASTLYFHDKCLYFHKDCKLTNIGDYLLPNSMYKIIETEKVELLRDKAEHNLLGYYAPINDSLVVCVTDFKCKTCLININTGQTVKIMDPIQFKPLDLYAKYIDKNRKAVALAREKSAALQAINRNEISFEIARMYNGFLYLTGDIQVMRKLDEDYFYVDDKGIQQVLKKGEIHAPYYPFILRMTPDFENPKFYFSKKSPFKDKTENQLLESNYNFGFLVDRAFNLYSYNGLRPKAKVDLSIDAANLPAISKWKFKENGYISFVENTQLKHTASIRNIETVNMVDYIYEYNKKLYFNYDVQKYLFNMTTGAIVDSLRGDGTAPKKEIFAKFYTDTTTTFYNYKVLEQGELFDSNYFHIYVYKGKAFLEVRNRDFDLIHLSSIDAIENDVSFTEQYIKFDAENLFVCGGKTIVFITIEDNKIYLNKYQITKNNYSLD